MSEKDYFGDDWVDDVELGESQIEYPEDLLDESFGVDEGASESKNTMPKVPPQRPRVGVAGYPKLEDGDVIEDVPKAGKSIPNFAIKASEQTSNELGFEESSNVEKGAGNPVPTITNIPNARIARQGESSPRRPGVAASLEDKNEGSLDAPDSPKDLIDIVDSAIDETIIVSEGIRTVSGEVDIDYDPDEDILDSEEDFPIDISTVKVGENEEYYSNLDDEEPDNEAALKAGSETPNRTSVRKRKPGPKKRKGPKPGMRLTARDIQILTFLARYRVATVSQIARMFGTSETALRNRLPRLEKEKMVSWAWGAQSKPKLWLITRQGLQVANMTLTVPTVKWGQLRHTLGLTDLGIEFELAGEVVISEREIRAAATRYTPTSRIKTAVDFMHYVKSYEEEEESDQIQKALIVPMATRSFGHIPDMVLARQSYPNGASGNIAIELELNRKHNNEWVSVLTAYRDTNLFESVQYYTMNKEIKRALTAIVKALGAEDKILIHYFVPIDNTADPLVTGGK